MSEWQPAETAPKDRLVLGKFYMQPFPVPVHWNEHDEKWSYPNLYAEAICRDDGVFSNVWFESEQEHDKYLVGWMDLPLVD